MAYETKDNTGRLFKNEEKKERGPDYSGTALIDGAEYYMDAWLKTADSGRKWMSFSFKPKQKQEPQKPQKPQSRARDDDDVPF